MNVLKNLFTDLENLFSIFNDFDYSKLILLTITMTIVYLINIFVLHRYHKNKINKTQIELKRINLEANLNLKKQNLSKLYIAIFLFISFLIISNNNLALIIPVLSALILILLFSNKRAIKQYLLRFSL